MPWKKSGGDEYSVSFSRSSVVLEKDYNYDSGPIVLRIFNEDGILIAYAAPFEIDKDGAVKEFVLDASDLFNLVEEQIYKYSETSKNVLDELRDLELRHKERNREE